MARADESFIQGLFDELTNLSTITESFVLPTRGVVDDIEEKVTLRMMTTHEEKLRTGNHAVSFFENMADIINRCVVEPKGFDAYKLTVVDFIFLMYKLRIVTYGKDYKVNVTSCPLCGKGLSDVSVNLEELKVTYIDDMPEKYRGKTIHLTLPTTKWDVEVRMLHIDEYDAIQDEAEDIHEKYPNYEGDPAVSLRLAKQIHTIKGQELSDATKQKLVNQLPAADEVVITRTFEKITMGLDLNAKYKCPHCRKKFNIPLSWSEEFFRPSSDE